MMWDKLKEELSKAVSDGCDKAKELKEHINEEFQILKLKKRLSQLQKERDSVLRDMGQLVFDSIQDGKSLEETLFQGSFDYIKGIEKQIEDQEIKINQIYQEAKNKAEREKSADDEIAVEVDKTDGD